MKLDIAAAELRSLLDAPSPATLTLYREDGEAIARRVLAPSSGSMVTRPRT